jgi:cell wall-associated NlpC family hydrolase
LAHAAARLVRLGLVGALAFHVSHIARDDTKSHDTKDTGRKAETGQGLGRRIVAKALAQRGVPYTWGGGGPRGKSRGICCSPGGADGRETIGFDCSGLVLHAVYQASDGRIILPRVAQDQVQRGKPVPRTSMRPGDLIGFDHGQGITHIGIYIGNGQMVHAPQTGDVVKISPLAPRTNQRWSIRRLR